MIFLLKTVLLFCIDSKSKATDSKEIIILGGLAQDKPNNVNSTLGGCGQKESKYGCIGKSTNGLNTTVYGYAISGSTARVDDENEEINHENPMNPLFRLRKTNSVYW